MFRISARDTHAWRDMAQNLGKLSLAGMFLTGTFLLAHAYAEPVHAKTASISTVSTGLALSSVPIRP